TAATADELDSAWPGAAPTEDRSVDALRMKLCDDDSLTRVHAIVALGKVGSLDDVGLLSDLLALPESTDEHPMERDAIMHTLKRLAGMTTSEFPMPKIEPASQSTTNVDDSYSEQLANLFNDPSFGQASNAQQPGWTCSCCASEVPGGFERCWNC